MSRSDMGNDPRSPEFEAAQGGNDGGTKVQQALGRLADVIPYGNLLASTDPTAFCDSVVAELAALRAVMEASDDLASDWNGEPEVVTFGDQDESMAFVDYEKMRTFVEVLARAKEVGK
jgi:hypothetical protein